MTLDAAGALALINDELARRRRPPLTLSEDHSQQAFRSLQAYAHSAGVSLQQAVADMVRFQVQSVELEALRRQS